MIPSAPLFLTSFEIVLLIINFALFSYGHPDAKMSLYRLKSRGTLPSNAISHHRRSAQVAQPLSYSPFQVLIMIYIRFYCAKIVHSTQLYSEDQVGSYGA